MSRIKSRDTKPEILIGKFLKSLKIPFKKHHRFLAGRPDFYISHLNLVIEIHGCFWHGHQGCKYFVIPKSNTKFWTDKITANVQRDKKVRTLLTKQGLKVLTIWECQLRDGTFLPKLLNMISALK